MKLSKLLLVAPVFAFSAISANATVTFTGSSLLNVANVSIGDVAVLLIDNTNAGFGSLSVGETLSIVSSSTYGSAFTVFGGTSKTVANSFGSAALSGAYSGIGLGGGVDTGDRFAIVVFSTSTTTTVGGDTYRIFTDPTWVVPADASTISFAASPTGSQFKQLGASATPAFIKTVTTSVVPEPSSYAAIAGLGILGFAASRRRRVA